MTTTMPTPNADTLVKKRYLQPGETVDGLFERVADAVALGSPGKDRRRRYLDLMRSFRFLPNSPTLMNAGLSGTMSACFVLNPEDSLDSIFAMGDLAGKVLKFGGGVGYGLSALRPSGSPIKSTGGKARGPVAALSYYQSIAAFVEQGGKRDGAQMAILHCDHPDIERFVDVKNGHPEAFDTFNISVALTDRFMSALQAGSGGDHGHPPGYGVAERRLLMKMAENAWKTGDPGCYFIDRAEKDNPTPHLGKLETTNPCGEVPLLHGEACNLGSLNLAAYWEPDSEYNWDGLEHDVKLAVRFLDDVITVNNYPHRIIEEAVKRTRKIGLGVMGWADLLFLEGTPYDSDAAIVLADLLAGHIRKWADEASLDLAAERGAYPAQRVNDEHYRNATRLCIAPTGSISILAGCSSGIEPHFALEYMREMGDGTKLPTREPILDRNLPTPGDDRPIPTLPKTAHEIEPHWHLRHQAAWQRHVDLAVSKTINLPAHGYGPQSIYQLYISAWQLGCKGVTIYRDGSRKGQVLVADSKEEGDAEGIPVLQTTAPPPAATLNQVGTKPDDAPSSSLSNVNVRDHLPTERRAFTHKFQVGGQKGYITIGMYEDGRPGEVFLTLNREGTAARGWADLTATFISLLLQHGAPLEEITDKLRRTQFEPMGVTTNPDIRMATSIPDYLGHLLLLKFRNGQEQAEGSPDICPECGAPAVVHQEGCLLCRSCGWTRC